MMRTYLYTPHSVTIDDVCNAFKINVDVRFIDSKTYRKFIIYHMVSYNTRRIYERLGIELYKDLAMPAFMLAPFVPRDTDAKEVKSDFIRITAPNKIRDFTFDHPYFAGAVETPENWNSSGYVIAYKMRTKIIIPSSTTAEQVFAALPNNFQGYITVEERPDIKICWICHTTLIDTKKIYHKLGIKLHDTHLLPLFL